MKITSVDHITINLKNTKESLHFYGRLLGLNQLASIDMGDHLLRYFDLPGCCKLELIEYYFDTQTACSESTDRGIARHFAFEVDDVYAVEKILTEAGYPFHVPVIHVEKLHFSGGLTRDPNGFELEFLQRD